MRTLRDGLKYWLALAVVACLPLTGRAAMFQVPVAAGGGGSVTTGSVTVVSGSGVALNGTVLSLSTTLSNLNGTGALTNASSRDFYASSGNLYSKNLSLNHRWVYYDDFNQPMTTPGVFPDSPTGHKYNVFTGGGGNTNKINLVDGKWWLGETGAVYQSVTFGTNGVYGSAAPINTWGGTFSYQRSTNNTPDGYEQNLFFILSPQVDFLPTNYLHITVGANIFRVQRELSSTNIIYAQHFGGRYLAFDTNHSFTVTIISNNIICDIAGMRYVGYDESLSTTYGNIKVATWEAIGSPTNQFWGKWDSQYAGYADNEAHWQYAGPFGVRSNGTLQKITFNDQTESRYQLKHESDLFQLYDAIAGEILFSADDTAQVVTVGGASAGTVNIIRPLIYTSGTPGAGKVIADPDGSGTMVWSTPSGGSSNMVTAEIGRLNITNGVVMTGPAIPLFSLSSYQSDATAFTRATNSPAATGSTNDIQISRSSATAGQVLTLHSTASGQHVWTNATPSAGTSTTNFDRTIHTNGFIVGSALTGSGTISNHFQIQESGPFRRTEWHTARGSATSLHDMGDPGVQSGSGVARSATSSNSVGIAQYTAATSGNVSGWSSTGESYVPGKNLLLHGIEGIYGTTNASRLWFGFYSDSVSTAGGNDYPSTRHVAALRGTATNQNWWFVTANASTVTETDTGVAMSTYQRLRITIQESVIGSVTNWYCYINGTRVATNSTSQPANAMRWISSLTTLENVAKTNVFEWVKISEDVP